MKIFKVAAGTKCRLVNLAEGKEYPFTTRKEQVFDREDIVFDPVTEYNTNHKIIEEYGFVGGDPSQRTKYLLVVNVRHVEIE